MASTLTPTNRTDEGQAGTEGKKRSRVAIACQGGGSHTAFSAGVLQGLLRSLPDDVEVVALSGTSGGAICAALAWDGLVRGQPERAVDQLKSFWDANAATEPMDGLINLSVINAMVLREVMAVPEISPYDIPTWGAEVFRKLLNDFFDFEELRELARKPGAPGLHLGAVEVVSGQFDLFTGEELCVECLLASAAIPELYRAVHVPGRGDYWDGLFSQNPPIHDLVHFNINELWVIQINANAVSEIPTSVEQIRDRRNALAGNLSMEQELRFIETFNRGIATGVISSERFHPIAVSRIQMDREFGYRSKMSRFPRFMEDLQQYGRSKARLFLRDRTRKLYTMKALGMVPQGK